MDAGKRIAECRDISQISEIYTGWLSQSARRLEEELTATSEQINTLGTEYVTALQGVVNFAPEGPGPDKSADFQPSAMRRAA
jgi:hypothetical protein